MLYVYKCSKIFSQLSTNILNEHVCCDKNGCVIVSKRILMTKRKKKSYQTPLKINPQPPVDILNVSHFPHFRNTLSRFVWHEVTCFHKAPHSSCPPFFSLSCFMWITHYKWPFRADWARQIFSNFSLLSIFLIFFSFFSYCSFGLCLSAVGF